MPALPPTPTVRVPATGSAPADPSDQPPGAPSTPGTVTALLRAHRAGESGALERVYAVAYEHLRGVARAQLRREGRVRGAGHTLSTTALVHEAYLKLADPGVLDVRDRGHFLALAARAMRQVLVEYARRHRAGKRGDGVVPLDLDDVQVAVDERAEQLVALDEALARLATFADRLARVIELRFFGGLSEAEVASVLGLTDRTVRRDWVKARAWLHAELSAPPTDVR